MKHLRLKDTRKRNYLFQKELYKKSLKISLINFSSLKNKFLFLKKEFLSLKNNEDENSKNKHKNLKEQLKKLNVKEINLSRSLFFTNKKQSSKTQIVRRCILNNRARGSIRSFGISRSVLRDMLSCGIIPGYKKCVW
jgi:ribosomal protein S14